MAESIVLADSSLEVLQNFEQAGSQFQRAVREIAPLSLVCERTAFF